MRALENAVWTIFVIKLGIQGKQTLLILVHFIRRTMESATQPLCAGNARGSTLYYSEEGYEWILRKKVRHTLS